MAISDADARVSLSGISKACCDEDLGDGVASGPSTRCNDGEGEWETWETYETYETFESRQKCPFDEPNETDKNDLTEKTEFRDGATASWDTGTMGDGACGTAVCETLDYSLLDMVSSMFSQLPKGYG